MAKLSYRFAKPPHPSPSRGEGKVDHFPLPSPPPELNE